MEPQKGAYTDYCPLEKGSARGSVLARGREVKTAWCERIYLESNCIIPSPVFEPSAPLPPQIIYIYIYIYICVCIYLFIFPLMYDVSILGGISLGMPELKFGGASRCVEFCGEPYNPKVQEV